MPEFTAAATAEDGTGAQTGRLHQAARGKTVDRQNSPGSGHTL